MMKDPPTDPIPPQLALKISCRDIFWKYDTHATR